MWDEDDTLGRWIQGIAAMFLAIFALGGIYMALHYTFVMLYFVAIPVVYGSIRIGWRCAYYAVTGQNNINRDDF
jgi:hypothetical protein